MDNESHISVFVKDMRVNVRIGLYEQERKAPQPLNVSIELFTAPSYLDEVDETKIIDYAKIHAAIKSWEERDHVELIEAYLKELIALGFSFNSVQALKASIAKPDIFDDVHGAGLSAYMRRDEMSPALD